MKKKSEITPMMRQYLEIKERHRDVFLFFRMGDFYELFFEDAKEASRILNITLTTRGTHLGEDIPMCGVPYHSVDTYLARMIEANRKVAICEQVEDPRQARGVVKRRVVRIVTPGTVIDDSLLQASKKNYLACIVRTGAVWGLAFVELSTGEFRVTELDDFQEMKRELSRIDPSELIVPKSLEEKLGRDEYFQRNRRICLFAADWIFDFKSALERLTRHYKVRTLDGFGMEKSVPGVAAAGGVLHYVGEHCPDALEQLNRISRYDLSEFMSLDEATKRNLELVEKRQGGEGPTLIEVLDHTRTPMGGRLLREWIHSPLRSLKPVVERRDAVSAFRENFEALVETRKILADVSDLERIIGRVVCGNATPRDLLGLRRSLSLLPAIRRAAGPLEGAFFERIVLVLHDFEKLTRRIEKAIHPEAPLSLREGGVIRPGFHAELDELRDTARNAKSRIAAVQKKESEKTGIRNLKIKFNNVFGYYIEVSKGQIDAVPDYFVRKQTLVNAERYITRELKELESRILGAEQKALVLEQKLFQEIRGFAAGYSKPVKESAHGIALLDAAASLAEAASRYDYVSPEIDDTDRILIRDGRHPVVERIMEPGSFISNDIEMDCGANQILIITGPNMAGKSTIIRQAALLVLMAQIGSHLPAREARIGVVDRIFTRVGAWDDLSGGKSTFMVEMSETANILNNATNRSLIVLDEIGRGTSTFDGISIAWAVIEYLSYHPRVHAKTLFATHYHELTRLEKSLKGVRNYNIAVKEWNDEIIFLHKLNEGCADKSYGIHVARLAGIPLDVIKRSRELLARLESGGMDELPALSEGEESRRRGLQLDLFARPSAPPPGDPKYREFVEAFASIDCLGITPMEAMNRLFEWVEKGKRIRREEREQGT